MSLWYVPKIADIDLSDNGEEIHILIDHDKNGNIYVSVKVEDIKKILLSRD